MKGGGTRRRRRREEKRARGGTQESGGFYYTSALITLLRGGTCFVKLKGLLFRHAGNCRRIFVPSGASCAEPPETGGETM